MAKIALIFVLFALFAVCMAGRITREDAKPDAKLPTAQEIVDSLKNLGDSEQFKEWQKKGQEVFQDVLTKIQELSKNANEEIQKQKIPAA